MIKHRKRTLKRCNQLRARCVDEITRAIKDPKILNERNDLKDDLDPRTPQNENVLYQMIGAVDEKFLFSELREAEEQGKIVLNAFWNKRTTRSAGKIRIQRIFGVLVTTISISHLHVFSNFTDFFWEKLYYDSSTLLPIVNGIRTESRIEAAIIILQHELAHLIEFLNTGRTGHRNGFKKIAYGTFGHTSTCHQLGTQYRFLENVAMAANEIKMENEQ